MSRQFAIVTLGCKTNQFESAAISEQLQQAGYRNLPLEEGPDLVIVNTCTVTAATDSQSRNLIRRARRLNSKVRVVVTGCYAQVDAESLAALPGVALVVGNQEKEDFLRHLTALDEDQPRIAVGDISRADQARPLALTSFEQRSRAFVQIQNGCDAFCSYCIIPYARGRSRSVALAEVVTQVGRLTESGHAEVVLTGIHIGNYGQDLSPATSLLELLRAIRSGTAVRRLRLGSLEPTEIPQQLRAYIAANDWICPHYHIPLQAGDDDILTRMNRHYHTAFFTELLTDIRQRQPQAAIGLDLIVGFPGETEESFERTLALIRRLPATHLHVFPYSRRPGTPAADMPDQVPGHVARERAARLRQLGEDMQREFARTFIGQELEVVIEGGIHNGQRKGLSQNYLPVYLPAAQVRPGECHKVKITSAAGEGLLGNMYK
ncbi:MAG: tRNA (N(6)-L-threonylcarbamoyladenosine(37)-C(2))-methylthiotransferase MtaB [Desulfuromonadales bacterium]|nr:tRNA (N(6)-L-threonylcarbamoyladenosine(37)-C(2))-methylthiotransferase MtaB [Desulfuromonadales bacterium]